MVDRCKANVIFTRPGEAEIGPVRIGQADELVVWRTDAGRLITIAPKHEGGPFSRRGNTAIGCIPPLPAITDYLSQPKRPAHCDSAGAVGEFAIAGGTDQDELLGQIATHFDSYLVTIWAILWPLSYQSVVNEGA
jgi:hypothetical protein